jgi:hypothetical protein
MGASDIFSSNTNDGYIQIIRARVWNLSLTPLEDSNTGLQVLSCEAKRRIERERRRCHGGQKYLINKETI